MLNPLDHNLIRFLALPGTDIFTRRRTSIEQNWMRGSRRVLDAGFGNGWFAYRACKTGATVTAVANQSELIEKARSLYNGYLGIPETRLKFMEMNLYDVANLEDAFDEIICYETLEHIRNDQLVCQVFHDLLKPGGVLHLCCPNAEHPRWRHEKIDFDETGGHVRAGYTEWGYRALLEPIGFHVERLEGIGGPLLVRLQENVQVPARRWFGEAGAAAAAFIGMPLIWFDVLTPTVPFSIYVRAIRPK